MENVPDYIVLGGVLLGCILVIILYGSYRCRYMTSADPITYCPTTGVLCNFIDGWGILHMLLFGILTYFYPHRWFELFILGVLWEGLECIASEHPFYITKCREIHKSSQWWYGRWSDIVMNSIGITIGYNIARRIIDGDSDE